MKFGLKEKSCVMVWIMMIIGLLVCTGCKLTWGGGPAGDDDEQDTGFARDIERVSVSTSGSQANGDSFSPAISSDGRFVAFSSDAVDLVPGDTNSSFDSFIVDRDTLAAERLSVSSGEVEGNSDSGRPSISLSNRYAVFSSMATNLISQDTNGSEDVFVRDRNAEQTRRVSLAFDGSQGDNDSFSAVISEDGRFVAFTSSAENLVANDTNGVFDIFVIPNPF